jgi:ABC-2 type transport system ATP-binding protein
VTSGDGATRTVWPLTIDDPHKTYGRGAVASDGIPINTNPGEVYGLLGPNGAGNTTLVKQVIGLLKPTSAPATRWPNPGAARQLCSYYLNRETGSMEEKNVAIQVHGLQKSYKKLQVLKGVDLDVARGSIFALLGSNGAGKTTIVRILTTLLKPDAGTTHVNGFDVLSQPARVRESISLTGQFAAVDEILTGRENLLMIAELRHVKSTGKVADDLLERFGLADAAGRRVSTYSGGMRRRLDIAMSLIGNPRIIFLDEPTAGLDPEGRIEVWQVIQNLADSGTTVFLTTQYLDEAEKLADRIAILHEGTIIVSGTLEELRKLLPPAKVEYVERQPSLEEIFLAIVGSDKKEQR